MKLIRAKKISGSVKRKRKNVEAIVLHWTGNKGDTARANCNYFKNGNNRSAGAHIFLDEKECLRSVPMNVIANAVGGSIVSRANGASQYHAVYSNKNTVSIEICNFNSELSAKKKKQLKKAIKYVKRYCPNVRDVVLHYDITGKDCPHYLVTHKEYWYKLRKECRTWL